MFFADYPVSGGVLSLNGLVGNLNLVGAGGITITPSGSTITITGSGGTVTSVGLADDSTIPIYSISGSPVTTAGTLGLTLNNQTTHAVFAGPSTGSAAQPTFRALVVSDLSFAGMANGVATLDSSGKVPLSELPSAVFIYQGTWNPSTNTPALTDGTGVTGYTYWVNTAYAPTVPGLSNPSMYNFQIGDLVIYNGTQWELTTPAAGVQSVNGMTGAVVIAGGANQSLSNLTSPTAINQNLIPNADNTYTLGAPGTSWQTLNTITISDDSGNYAENISNRQLINVTGYTTVDWQNQFLYNATGIKTVAWSLGQLYRPDTSLSIDWVNGLLNSDDGNTQLSWDTTGVGIYQSLNLINQSSGNQINIVTGTLGSTYTLTMPPNQASGIQFLRNNGSGQLSWVTGNAGSVTSVALADSTGLFNITGSPVTSSGTLTLSSFKNQAANTFFAAPNGSSGAPTFRLIVPADVPTLNQNTNGTAANITATSNSTLTTLSALSLPGSQVTGNISGNAANITATSNSTLTTLSSLSLPTTQLTGTLQASQFPALTGDITTTAGSLATTLATVNSSPGTYTYATLTVNAKGLVTSASSGAAPLSNPMTSVGDIIYGGTSGTPTRLAGNTTTTTQVLTQTGTGSASSAPVWTTLTPPTRQIFTSGSGATYTTPAGAKYLKVTLLGGGGAGGGAGATTGNGAAGGGGGSGALLIGTITSPSSTYTYTVGAGGTAGAAGANSGNAGGNSTFSTFTAGGGGGGGGATPQSGMAANSGGPGAGGTASGGDLPSSTGTPGGGGFTINATQGYCGWGGSSAYGGGAPVLARGSAALANTGVNATGYGSGGGGGLSLGTNTTAVTGGTGTSGFILVEEFYT